MFTIDLLKGRYIPIKSRPEGMAITAVAVIVPVTIAIITFACYFNNSINITLQKKQIAEYTSKIDQLSHAVALYQSFEKKQGTIKASLSEVASSIGRYTQWTPVLATLVENMPDSMVLTKLEVRQRSVRKRVPQKDNPEKMMEVNVPARVLGMNLCGKPQQSYGRAIRDFRDRLRSSKVLGPKLENINVAQETDRLDGQDVVSYQVECIFKPQM
jgi:Tfp pilus assembly protein PilN